MRRSLLLLLGLTLACDKNGPATKSPEIPAPGPKPGPATANQPGGPPAPTRKILLRNARVMTAAGKVFERGDLLIDGDRIAEVGVGVAAPQGATVIDLTGKTLTPGIIDTHSHIGVYAAPGLTGHNDGNEAIAPNTAGVRSADAFFPQDPQIDHARAGGITTMQILPGSANLFGGRSVTVRLLPDIRSVDDARFPGAPEGLKMACGENPKRMYGQKSGPATRMGNVAGYRDAFQKAREYQRNWDKYRRDHIKYLEERDKPPPAPPPQPAGSPPAPEPKKPDEPQPPAKDLAMETLSGVLRGEILVHNHCYRADEMALMLEIAASFGFRIRSFHHATEAYKIADLLAAAGTSASVWADWWGFKAEAFDGIRENAALLHQAGARAIIHSDSAIGIQRLNQEAAKAMHAGRRIGIDISDDTALKWITLYPAWALGIEAATGSLEPGKFADLVVWSGDPFSVYTLAEQVFIAGAQVYVRGKVEPHADFDLGYRPAGVP
jgi:imidazolonepropionase-like amidohydrolase